jgi:hypothetical protein
MDNWHLLLLNPKDFCSLEASQPEVTFSNLAKVPKIPTAPPHHLWVQLLPQQAKSDVLIDTIASHGQVAGLRQPRLPQPHLLLSTPAPQSFLLDVSFHVSFHVKFGYMGWCDFNINNSQNTCLVM